MTWTPETVIAGIAALGLGGILTEIFRWLATGRSQKISDTRSLVEASTVVVESYDRLVEELRVQLDAQQKQIEGLQAQQVQNRTDIGILQTRNGDLVKQIEALHSDYQALSEKYQHCQSELVYQKEQNG